MSRVFRIARLIVGLPILIVGLAVFLFGAWIAEDWITGGDKCN